jgi:hypothetical protein
MGNGRVKIILSVFLVVLGVWMLFYYGPAKLARFRDETISAPPDQAALMNGLIAYWKFDEGTGHIASDSSGHGNNAMLSNNPDWSRGRFGGAIHTDGTGLIRIKRASFDLSSDITVATWIYQEPDGGNNTQSTVLVSTDAAGSRKFAIYLDRTNKRVCIQTTKIDSCTGFDTYMALGTWFHLALSKSTRRARIYVNGAAIGSDLDTENASGSDIGIGRYTLVELRGCNCSFDEFRIYNRILSGREIAALFNDNGVPYTSGNGTISPQ